MTEDDTDIQGRLNGRFASEFGADEGTARTAAERAAALCADYEEAVSAEGVLEAVAAVERYDSFQHRYNCAVGDLAAGVEDCTDSRAYRLAGFGALAADPEQGA
ncbi:MAG: hypothetical protein V5A13_03480 [Haloarculaceae archaeon]